MVVITRGYQTNNGTVPQQVLLYFDFVMVGGCFDVRGLLSLLTGNETMEREITVPIVSIFFEAKSSKCYITIG